MNYHNVNFGRFFFKYWKVTSPRVKFELGLYPNHEAKWVPELTITLLFWEVRVGMKR